jgi:hypothetical protein
VVEVVLIMMLIPAMELRDRYGSLQKQSRSKHHHCKHITPSLPEHHHTTTSNFAGFSPCRSRGSLSEASRRSRYSYVYHAVKQGGTIKYHISENPDIVRRLLAV